MATNLLQILTRTRKETLRPSPAMKDYRVASFQDEECCVNDAPPSSSSDSDNPEAIMKPMSVSTDLDYGVSANSADSNRKAIYASLLSIAFLAIGWLLTDEYHAAVMKSQSSGGGPSIGGLDTHPLGPSTSSSSTSHTCQEYNGTYFADLMKRVETSTQADLCGKEKKSRDCRCANPFVPIPQQAYAGWHSVVEMNIALLQDNYSSVQPDVVLYGDSITEHLLGRSYGKVTPRYDGLVNVTESVLTKGGGGKINGLPMGIAGDFMAHLLWRLQNGEMPDSLQPRVWWILIGTNDLGMGCSADTIVAGNIRIVEEIRQKHDYHNFGILHNTMVPIVMNSILPKSQFELLHSQPSPWPLLQQVHQQLECYAQNNPGVYFMNATDSLIHTNEEGVFLNEDLFDADHFHPNAKGTRVWLEWLVEQVVDLMT